MTVAEAQQVLGLTSTPEDTETYRAALTDAWKQAARRYHPDLNKDADAGAQFVKAKKAYDVLTRASKGLPPEDPLPEEQDDDDAFEAQVALLLGELIHAVTELRGVYVALSTELADTQDQLDATRDHVEALTEQFTQFRNDVARAFQNQRAVQRTAAAKPAPAPPRPSTPPGQWDPPARAGRARAPVDGLRGLDKVVELVHKMNKRQRG